MLKKSYRVPVGNFPRGAPTALSGGHFVIKVSKNTLPHSRAGVVVGRGVVKKATNRNAVKRSVYRAFESHPDIIEKPGKDYLVIIKSPGVFDESSYKSLNEELEQAVSKLRHDI